MVSVALAEPRSTVPVQYGVLRGDLFPLIQAAVAAAHDRGFDISKHRIYVYDNGRTYVVSFGDGAYEDNPLKTPRTLKPFDVAINKADLKVVDFVFGK